jgi:hypothetical protein
LDIKKIIYTLIIKNGNSISYDNAIGDVKCDKIGLFSQSALKQAQKKIGTELLQLFNDNIVEYIYKDHNVNKIRRFIGIDGTFPNVQKKLGDYGYSLSENKKYCTVLISGMYDIFNNVPINYNIVKHKNERDALVEQLKYVNENDVLIMDRGYFNGQLLHLLIAKKIDFIFRIKKNSLLVNKIKIDTNEGYYTIFNKPLKLVSYIIDNNVDDPYYLCTSLIDYSIDLLKQLYWRRWDIETQFRYNKSELTLKHLLSKTHITLVHDILSIQLIMILNGYFQNMLQVNINNIDNINKNQLIDVNAKAIIKNKPIKINEMKNFKNNLLINNNIDELINLTNNKQKINTNSSLNKIINKVIPILFFKKMTKLNISTIKNILFVIMTTKYKVIKNRHYPRVIIFHRQKTYDTYKKKP